MASQRGKRVARRGRRSLAWTHGNRLGAGAGTLVRRDLKFNGLTFGQPVEASPRDHRVMKEYICTATGRLNESKAFVAHQSFDKPSGHCGAHP